MDKNQFNCLMNDMRCSRDEWMVGEFCFKKNGFEVWTANGFLYYGIYKPEKIRFSFIQKVRFSRAFKKIKKIRGMSMKMENFDEYISTKKYEEIEILKKIWAMDGADNETT